MKQTRRFIAIGLAAARRAPFLVSSSLVSSSLVSIGIGTIGLGAIGIGAGATSARAASPFSSTLTTLTGDSSQAATQTALTAAGLSVFSTAGFNDNGTPDDVGDDSHVAVVFDGDGAHFGNLFAGDGGRNYVRTLGDDYATMSFVAEITFASNSDDQAAFFGIGAGDTALFGTPDWSTQFSSAGFWPETGNDKMVAFRTQNDVNAFVDKPIPGFDVGIHRLRMSFDAATRLLVGSIDLNYAGGPFTADATTLPIATATLFAADGWPSEPSRIYFGGDDNVVFRDLTVRVVPESASALLWIVGALSIGRRRRPKQTNLCLVDR